jgi:hypothetical protein
LADHCCPSSHNQSSCSSFSESLVRQSS